MQKSEGNPYNLLFFYSLIGTEEKILKFELPHKRQINLKTGLLNLKTEDLISILDKSQVRLMNRAACGLIYFAQKFDLKNEFRAALAENAGLYCFNNNSEFPYHVLPKDELDKSFGPENLAPSDLFKRSNAVSTSQLANFLEIKGPVNTYTNQNWGMAHAADNAFEDLKSGRVNRALLAGVQVIESDPFNFLNSDESSDNTNAEKIFERIVLIGLTDNSDKRIKDELKNCFVTNKEVR